MNERLRYLSIFAFIAVTTIGCGSTQTVNESACTRPALSDREKAEAILKSDERSEEEARVGLISQEAFEQVKKSFDHQMALKIREQDIACVKLQQGVPIKSSSW